MCNFSIYCANKCEPNLQLMLLSSVAFCAAGVGQLTSLSSCLLCTPPSSSLLLLSQGDVWVCWDSCADKINICALYHCCYIALKALNHRNDSPCPLLFTLFFSLLYSYSFPSFTWLFGFALPKFTVFPLFLSELFSLFNLYSTHFSLIFVFLSLLYFFPYFIFLPPFFVLLQNAECFRWKW